MTKYDFLLDKKMAEKFLNNKLGKIFKTRLSIVEIKRFKTYNLNNYNILYKIKNDQELFEIRISTSKYMSKTVDYTAMKFFYNHGFSKGNYITPEPLVFLEKDNLLIYKNIEGAKLSDLLESYNINELVGNSADLLKKIHLLKDENLKLFNPENWFIHYDYENLIQKFSKAKNLKKIISNIKESLSKEDSKCICHGDFQPNNIIINQEQICLIDFGMTCIFYPEVDLASFLTHLRMLLKNEVKYINLKKLFLQSYGPYNEKILYLLMSLISCRLFEISITFEKINYDTEFLYQCLIDDLKHAEIKNEF